MNHLKEGFISQDGFVNPDYFPIRFINHQIKQKKNEIKNLYLENLENIEIEKQE